MLKGKSIFIFAFWAMFCGYYLGFHKRNISKEEFESRIKAIGGNANHPRWGNISSVWHPWNNRELYVVTLWKFRDLDKPPVYPEDWTGIRETDVIKAQHRYGNGMVPHMLTHAIHPVMVRETNGCCVGDVQCHWSYFGLVRYRSLEDQLELFEKMEPNLVHKLAAVEVSESVNVYAAWGIPWIGSIYMLLVLGIIYSIVSCIGFCTGIEL